MLWFLGKKQAKNEVKNEHFWPRFFALSTDDIGDLADERRNFRWWEVKREEEQIHKHDKALT